MIWNRERYIAHSLFEDTGREMFCELFGPLIGLEDEWRAQGATPVWLGNFYNTFILKKQEEIISSCFFSIFILLIGISTAFTFRAIYVAFQKNILFINSSLNIGELFKSIFLHFRDTSVIFSAYYVGMRVAGAQCVAERQADAVQQQARLTVISTPMHAISPVMYVKLPDRSPIPTATTGAEMPIVWSEKPIWYWP